MQQGLGSNCVESFESKFGSHLIDSNKVQQSFTSGPQGGLSGRPLLNSMLTRAKDLGRHHELCRLCNAYAMLETFETRRTAYAFGWNCQAGRNGRIGELMKISSVMDPDQVRAKRWGTKVLDTISEKEVGKRNGQKKRHEIYQASYIFGKSCCIISLT